MATESVVFSEYAEKGPDLYSKNGQHIQATFRVSPINVTVANVIRRQILASIPTVGFKTEPPEESDIKIQTNTTALVNEMLMHRIGMLPISVADPSTFVPDMHEFRINVENVGASPVTVTAADIEVYRLNGDGSETKLANTGFFPCDPITNQCAIITVLRPRYNLDTAPEKLTLKARASIGTGRQNMRYSPVSQCSYEYTRDKSKEREDALFIKWLATNKKVSDVSKIPIDFAGELRREYDCMEIQRCYLQNAKGEPYDFTFHIESIGVYSVPTIVQEGLKACENLVEPYLTLATDLPDGNLAVTINRCATRAGGFELSFKNQEHTLGNLLQTFLTERHIEGTETPRIKYAGYKVPHPLRQEMVLVINPEDGNEASVREAVANVCAYLKGYFADILSSWQNTTGIGSSVATAQLVQPEQPVQPVQSATQNPKASKTKAPKLTPSVGAQTVPTAPTAPTAQTAPTAPTVPTIDPAPAETKPKTKAKPKTGKQ